MNILWVCQYYLPDKSAPSMRGSELTGFWKKSGNEVQVLTAFPHHPHGNIPPEYKRKFFENSGDIKRVCVFAKPNPGFIVRLLGQISFAFSVLFFFPFLNLKKPDVIVVSSPSPFVVLTGKIMAIFYGAKLVMDIRDLWPEVFVDLGLIKKGPIFYILSGFSRILYKCSNHLVVVTQGFKKQLEEERPYTKGKISYFPNGASLERFDSNKNEFKFTTEIENKLKDKKILSYIGTLGVSHGLDDMLKLARAFEQNQDYMFLFVGAGHGQEEIKSSGLSNVIYHPPVEPNDVIPIYRRSYFCFVSLKPIESFKHFIPSKMFEIMAAKRPIIGLVQGESRNILERARCGVLNDPGLSEVGAFGLKKQITSVSEETYENFCESGRMFVEIEFNREIIARNYLGLLKSLN